MKPRMSFNDALNLKEWPAGTSLEDMKAMLQQQLAGMGTEKDNENVTPQSEHALKRWRWITTTLHSKTKTSPWKP
jgi:hypothetical protein